MNQEVKDWVDILSKSLVVVGIYVAILNYRTQTRTKRGEWLRSLFEKFYENREFKDVRKWIESGEINKKINLDATVSDDEEKFTDYLNFFEFIAVITEQKQLRERDMLNLFDYYLQKLKLSPACMSWIENEAYGFENLKLLLDKLTRNGK